MLKRINNKLVRGTYFTVTVLDIHKVEYTEDGKTAVIEIEGGTGEQGQVDWLIYARIFHAWMPPHESENISIEKRSEILENVSQSLSVLGMPHRILER